MPDPFGSFRWICSHTPLPQCNLLFSQLFYQDNPPLTQLFPTSSNFFSQYNINGQSASEDPVVLAAKSAAGTGVGANCEIARVGQRGSSGDIALIVLSAVSLILALVLVFTASRRKAAVGRVELRLLLIVYGIHSALQLLTMSSLLEQGSKGLAILSSIHVAFVATLFWLLLGNGLIATQVVEDGTFSALVPLVIGSVLFFIATLYVSLDTSLHWTESFVLVGSDVGTLKATALFVLTLIWPAVAAVLYLVIMLYVVLGMLKEVKPAVLYLGSFLLFAVAQVIFFLASQPLCDSSNGKVNSAFLATLLECLSVITLYFAWRSITEDDWGEDEYPIW
ncbi:hypothetical protein CI109_105042 [Kwoniella shandongensis]|uniref:Uncharacterized protein n=1 Tax=Kwoniella shandongensis TaxID=1734106 RepID=A0A5M6C224_9TREE|nr:uncharacterized protein CI109_004359 [Kwoniella shandongensis]KAA5527299.1 hypothetical protein CI109_004359 [Kwoniella shandongensis]